MGKTIKVICMLLDKKMAKHILQHLQKILSSAIFGLVLFFLGVFLHPILGIQPKDYVFFDQVSVEELDTSIDDVRIIELINEYRQANGKPLLQTDTRLCQAAEVAVQQVERDEKLGDTLKNCPDCYNITVLTLSGTYKEEEIIESWKEQQSASLLEDSSVICAAHHTNIAAIALGNFKRGVKGAPTPQPTRILREIPDQEVVEALNAYRATHNVPSLTVNQDLCRYAEKRTRDLVAYGGLDGHAGFRRDFDDGKVPEELQNYPGRGIGENLAHQHCYRGNTNVVAETGSALIEWCFDSSTLGHREAQLNPKFNAVCVRHAQNMYVVIFGE